MSEIARLRDAAAPTDRLLDGRARTHGDYACVSAVYVDLLGALANGAADLSPAQRTAVDMIAMKMARIVCGDPGHADHWDDIAGYAFLAKRSAF